MDKIKFHTRDSQDETVVSKVIDGNVYNFPENMEGMVVLDLGAHIGTVSVLCASRGAKVWAFEPSPENLDLFEKNIKLNSDQLKGKIICFPFAIGKPGMRKLDINPMNKASNVLQGLNNHATYTDSFVEVKTVSLDGVFKSTKIEKCDYVKMDIEGAEVEIVDDIVKLHDKIKTIVCELHFNDVVQLYKEKLSPYFNLERMTGHSNRYEYCFTHK